MRIRGLELTGRTVLAPMAGITDPPFRRTVQRFGVSALWTEMMSAHALAVARKTFRTMNLEGHEVPTVFQICGYEPEVMADAARIVQDRGAAAVDINMGCPVRKIVQKGAGAALMKNLPLAGRILSAVRRAIGIALTVKIRSGWDEKDPNAAAFARVIEDAGADAVVVHARTRSQLHSGPASLNIVSEVKEAVKIPVIGNGGILSVDDAESMTKLTGCDGVMVGRGALGRPWLPGKILGRQGGEQG
ncbi:MAG: tRNA-dihydrouridine synthase family protein, partial [Deltaproteobacteria bacterium]